MVNNLQMVMNSPLINISFPGNAFMIYEVMITVASFDILPTDEIFPILFPALPPIDSPYDDLFERLQIASRYTVMNMGTMLLILTFYLLMYFLYPIFAFIKNDSRCGARMEAKLRPILFWNHSITFIYEGYLDMLIAGSINVLLL